MITVTERIEASLMAGCVADALGAPTEERSRDGIIDTFGGPVTTLVAPPPDAPFAAGRAPGEITDDASQMLALARTLAESGGDFSAELMADTLLAWSDDGRYYPQMAGPSTTAAIERLRSGEDPWSVGIIGNLSTQGSSNGAAMRSAPAGLANVGNLDAAVHVAYLSCVPSHHTTLGVAGAAAIAAATAIAATGTASLVEVIRAARNGALRGEALAAERGRVVAGPSMVRRIDLAVGAATSGTDRDAAVVEVADIAGVGLAAVEAVPCALGLFVATGGDPWQTAIAAANNGGDTDTIGCMAAAIAGAYSGCDAIPADIVAAVRRVNSLDLAPLAEGLARVSERSRG